VPSIVEEGDRRLHRERSRLLNERNEHVNRIKGLLAIQGIYDFEPMHRDRIRRQRLRTADGRKLPSRLKTKIVRELQRLELVLGMIGAMGVGRHGWGWVNRQREEPTCNGRRPSGGDTSRISREAYVGICERLRVKFPGPPRQIQTSRPQR